MIFQKQNIISFSLYSLCDVIILALSLFVCLFFLCLLLFVCLFCFVWLFCFFFGGGGGWSYDSENRILK